MTAFDPYAHIDRTPNRGGVVQDQFGWWLAYFVRADGSVKWLGVNPSRVVAERWVEEEQTDRAPA